MSPSSISSPGWNECGCSVPPATDLVWMAEGSVTASVMLSNKSWDTMAGVLIAREAGALILDMHGNEHTIDSDSTIAVLPQLADELLRLLRIA